jgi:hypothetical protein
MAIKYGKTFKVKKGSNLYKKMKRDRAAYARRRKVSPYQRLKGKAPMPYFKYERCWDAPPKLLSTSTHQDQGFWSDSLHTYANQIPGTANLLGIYRFFRIKKVIVQYTPCSRSDEYSKVFYVPSGLTPTQPYMAKGGALEIKQINYDGFLAHPNTWAACLNRAGKIRKCNGTQSFIRVCYPRINQVIQDLAGTDTQRSMRAPWLSTDVTTNLDIAHFIGYDCFHTLNDISYDVDQPLRINRRYVVTLEFKGLKI